MGKQETPVQNRIREALSKIGVINWRNNVGGLYDRNGRFVRFGLCEGSSDTIGIHSVVITPEMVGKTVGVFVGGEVKAPDGKDPSDEQIKFRKFIDSCGGIAFIAYSVQEALEAVANWRFNIGADPLE